MLRSGPRRKGKSGADALGFVQADGGLGEGVVVVLDGPDRGSQPGQGEGLAEVHGRILRARIGVMNGAADGVSLSGTQRSHLPDRGLHEPGSSLDADLVGLAMEPADLLLNPLRPDRPR